MNHKSFAHFGAGIIGLFVTLNAALAQDPAFTYQGRLNDNGTPANGSYDLTFTLFSASAGGSPVAGPVTNLAVAVNNGVFNIGDNLANVTIATWNGASLTDGGVWANASDRNRKTDFAEIDAQAVLAKLSTLPVREWRYTNEVSSVRHLGPTAQDFKAGFNLGADDKSIGTVDESGVALAAIQALNQKLMDELKRRDAENAALEARLKKLEQLLDAKVGENK